MNGRQACRQPAGYFIKYISMRVLLFFIVAAIVLAVISCSQNKSPDNLVLVKGGTFTDSTTNGKSVTIPDFYIGRYEVTQEEWIAIMGNNPAEFNGLHLPVESVSWYDCIEYCNKRSSKEGLRPYYNIDKSKKDSGNTNELDDMKWTVTINQDANGYRLPTEAEWEYASRGGNMSKHYKYSGSDSINQVAWYWQNSGDKYLTGAWSWETLQQNNNRPQPVGTKQPNELGLYDMSGNVREWCWDWYKSNDPNEPQGRIWKGGGWIGADFCCESSFRAQHQGNGKGPDQGFRVCR